MDDHSDDNSGDEIATSVNFFEGEDHNEHTLASMEALLTERNLHIFSRREGRKHKTLILLPFVDDLPTKEFIAMLKHRFGCGAGLVKFIVGKQTDSSSTVKKSAVTNSTPGFAISMTGSYSEEVKNLMSTRGHYKLENIILHGA